MTDTELFLLRALITLFFVGLIAAVVWLADNAHLLRWKYLRWLLPWTK